MICATDVYYYAQGATAALVAFKEWEDASPALALIRAIPDVMDYEPGAFYKRELPCLLAVIADLPSPPRLVVIDGHVWLRPGEPGLGHHLYFALGEKIPVIGVAKSSFDASPHAVQVYRGKSQKCLYVTAIGIDPEEAGAAIRCMHGDYRMPTLLTEADRLSRSVPPIS
jgi:deoxyribonuclease V